MGIPGLVQSLGHGERISLAKLAVDHLRLTTRPIRIAIDISIWLFQVQAGKGGANPELRTLFYRLVRLTGLPVHPLFVYDGPQRPQYKRGKLVGRSNGAGEVARIIQRSKRLIELFRFPYHTAPGEAEAECARLQRSGVVDAVMSDDIDTIMFGSKVTIMNFSKENSSGTNAATHVTLYRMEESEDGHKANVPLDRGGMILFAMLSGGDYLPAGVPKCGPKLAGEIAQAGFGNELLQSLEGNEPDVVVKLGKWRERLQNELNENTEGYFKRKHKAVQIPDSFPDLRTLRDYTHPIVSSPEKLKRLQQSIKWDEDIDIYGLRDFVAKDFGWRRSSARRLTKVLAAPLVCNRLRLCLPLLANLDLVPQREPPLGARLCGKRFHYSTDGLSELRLEFIPTEIVGLDLDYDCETSVTCSQDNSDPEELEILEVEDDGADFNPDNKRQSSYDPTQKDRVWVFEAVAEMGMPEAVKNWNTQQQEKLAAAEKRAARKKAPRVTKPKAVDPKMKFGEILKYGTIVKGPRTEASNSCLVSSQKSAPEENISSTPNYYAPGSSSQPLTSQSSQALSPGKEDLFGPLTPSKKAVLREFEAAMGYDSDDSDPCDAGIEGIEKALHDMDISANDSFSSPRQSCSRGISHKTATPNASLQSRTRSEYGGGLSFSLRSPSPDPSKSGKQDGHSNELLSSSAPSTSDCGLLTTDDHILVQFSELDIQDHRKDSPTELLHTTVIEDKLVPDIPPRAAATKSTSNDNNIKSIFKTENTLPPSNTPIQQEPAIIETYNGFWAYSRKTKGGGCSSSPEELSDNDSADTTLLKMRLDKKLGKMKLARRVSILDLSQ